MKIGVIGARNVGGTLGRGWSNAGHEVRYGSRKPEPGNIKETAAWAEVVVVATPWEAVPDAIKACGNLGGKVVVDCTNPLLPELAGLALGTTDSAGERAAALAKGARVVKAFNTVGYGIMANPEFSGGQRATMLYCGDDAAAKTTVRQLAADLGFDPVDAGPLRQARVLEPFAMLWISLAVHYGLGPNFAFHLMRR
jgi:predicted dinucleotide-binding enzyme